MNKIKTQENFNYWADDLVKDIKKGEHHRVDDMKTPSGHAHAGSLRAIATHGLVYEALLDAGFDVEFTYVINDMDPMDKLPIYIDQEIYVNHMGKPFYQVPAPDGKSENYAMQFANEYIEAFNKFGFNPKIFKSSELYKSGQLDKWIKIALDKTEIIRKIYLEVAGQAKPVGWYPFQVICPECGQVGANLVTEWDGKEVTYECKSDLVAWSSGCGHKGKISPFGGTGKLMWKVDWPAHWCALNITVEGAGKDHFSDGGSRYIGIEIMKKVFNVEAPFGFLHEFLLIGGAKMSSSRGTGMTSADFAKILPAELGRFLFARTNYQRAINFDPLLPDTIPDLYDEYDKCATKWFEEGRLGRFGRIYEVSQISKPVNRETYFLPRFRKISSLLQAREQNIQAIFEEEKGSHLNTKELEILNERIEYASLWLKDFLETDVIKIDTLNTSQKDFLKKLAIAIESQKFDDPEELQTLVFNITKSTDIKMSEAFSAVYIAVLGQNKGPKAGVLLLEELRKDKTKLLERLNL